MTQPRLAPPFWQHDAYTLRRLARAVEGAADRMPVAADATAGTAVPLVVDLGAGQAPYRDLFERRGARYMACDIDDALDDAHRIVPGRPLPLAGGSAQAVVSFQVLEHVWDLDAYLGEAHRLLHERGRLLLSTHGTWPYHPHPTDWRRWTRDGLLAELATRGFHAERVDALVGPLACTSQVRALAWHRLLSGVPLIGGLLAAVVGSWLHLRMIIEDALTPQRWIDTNAAVYLVLARKGAPRAVGSPAGSDTAEMAP